MIKTPLSTVIGGAFWTPSATILGSASRTLNQIIKSLFANNEQGFAYDPNDLSTMFQDAAGTIPVTVAGQPVGLIRDKSGRNNHAFQTTSASRPILQRNATTGAYYLAFDGADDFLQTNNIDFTATDKVSLFAGVRKLSDANAGALIELSTNASSTAGTFGINAPDGASSNDYLVRLRGIYDNFKRMTGNLAPVSSVVSARLDAQQLTVNNKINVRLNGITSAASGSGTPSTTQNFANQPLYIGRRGGATLPFNGHIYSLIGIGRLTTDNETMALEKELAKRTGVTLNV